MRIPLCAFFLIAACGRDPSPAVPASKSEPAAALPVLRAALLGADQTILVDGVLTERGWKGSTELLVDVGGIQLRLKAAWSAQQKRFYLLAVWQDDGLDMNDYWRYVALAKWDKFAGEDGFSICWSPGALHEEFREQGCAIFCHEGSHVRNEFGPGYADFWRWGAQSTSLFGQARDMWLPFGKNQRLRGDRQPENSDNVLNRSDEYEGPHFVPKHPSEHSKRLLVQ